MKKEIFVSGIGTDVGKTIASAIICESLKADYWKPIQAGDLENSDSIKVKKLCPNTLVHQEAYRLQTPASPHCAAEIDGINIQLDQIVNPQTNNTLVIEGAGGLMVPLNKKNTISDLIKPNQHVVLVSRNYLGSINHSLLSLNYLKSININKIGIIFVGDDTPSTQEIIKEMSHVSILGRIKIAKEINSEFIKQQAKLLNQSLLEFNQ